MMTAHCDPQCFVDSHSILGYLGKDSSHSIEFTQCKTLRVLGDEFSLDEMLITAFRNNKSFLGAQFSDKNSNVELTVLFVRISTVKGIEQDSLLSYGLSYILFV
jgi:hypothetical protein